MGLDHGLVRRPIPQDTELVTWRKEYWLREWFAECLHRFRDNGETPVTCEDLETLKMDIFTVLEEPDRASEIFPYSMTAYDEDFFEMLRKTKDEIRRIIDSTDWNNEQIYYWEWY